MDTIKKRILLVEDEPGYQELMQAILGKPFDLAVCTSAEEAMVKLDTERYHLIISDINMFGMMGFEILNRINQEGLSETCPVILCSSMLDPATKEKALSMKAAGFIPKPFDPQKVLAMVRTLLNVPE